jgi:hypothetical protein
MLDTVEAAVDVFESSDGSAPDPTALASFTALHSTEDARLQYDVALLARRRPDIEERLHLTR